MISIFINSMTSGGAEKVVLTLLEQYCNAGKEVELICIEREQYYTLPEGIKTTYLTDYETLENSRFRLFFVLLCTWRLVRHIKKHRVKIVQSHLIRASFISILAKLFGAGHHTQAVMHSSVNFVDNFKFLEWIYRWAYHKILIQADTLVSICIVMQQYLNNYFDLHSHPNHVVIYNPHNISELKGKAAASQSEFQYSEDKKYIVWAGRPVRRKRLSDLINAFHLIAPFCPNTEVILLGNGKALPDLKKLVKQLDLSEKVHFLSHQDNPYSHISRCDVMVLSSDMEGLPNIIIESMACGIPVISSDCVSGPREIIHPKTDLNVQIKDKVEYGEYGILYPVGRVDLLAAALRCMMEDDGMRTHYKAQGLERANSYDAVKIGRQYMETFHELEPNMRASLQNLSPLD